MDPPPPASDFPMPTPVIVAGKEVKQTISTTSAAPAPASTMLPPDSSDNRKPKPSEQPYTESAESYSTLPPPPPKIISTAVASSGAKNAQLREIRSSGYKPPSWGLTEAPEASGLSLTVLKGGIEVSSISLDNRTHVLLGRQQGVVDVLLEHPSISRKHAILQHGQEGALFLFDNGSTHGCTVNKTKIPPKEFHRLHVGDVIKFGESTRLYALEGPEELRPAEYESDNLRNLRLDAGRKQLAAKLAKLKAEAAGGGPGGGDSGEYGISWGFDEDAVAEDDDEDGEGGENNDEEVELPEYLKTEAQRRRRRDTKVSLTENSVHKRDAKLFEKLQLKLTKVEHLLTENERITAKEGGQGGLTEGQQAQLARNDKAITAVRLQIEEIEETIRSKNKARERSKEGEEVEGGGGKGAKESAEDGEEDDDYYDRTAPVVPVSSGKSGLDPASKKAEIRARRFGARDKTKKLAAAGATPSADSGPAVASGAGTGGSGVGGDAPVAQSLEALTRRAEAVAEDLERTHTGLVELEAEEAEEAGLEGGGGGTSGATADPLDMFMSENRKKERQQAVLRLTAKRESLQEEQARLKLMVEAARPSMPSLKKIPATTAPAGASVSKEHTAPATKPEVSPSQSGSATANGSDSAACGAKGGSGNGPKAAGQEEKEKGDETLPSPPTPVSTMPAPAVIPRPSAATEGRDAQVAARGEGAGAQAGVEGKPDHSPSQKETENISGVKRRGTPVGTPMLPPPPSKRPQRNQESLAPMRPPASGGGVGDGGDGSGAAASAGESNVKRTVKGPTAMPPPSGWKPSAAGSASTGKKTAASRGGSGAGARKKVAGKDVLEGGDVDWVPPKDALKKMAALNEKFGY
ncbi:unnamed protein product [Scytosiphon promiscuus]